MGKFDAKGRYCGYDKNNKEREALDYYATPPEEIENFLSFFYGEDKNDEPKIVLEPACGGGHMLNGLSNFFTKSNIIATDIMDREKIEIDKNIEIRCGKEYDFLSSDYPIKKADIVITNPPFKVGEAFVLHALEIAEEYVFIFEKTKFTESIGRYNALFKDNPPTYIYQYIDRVSCGKNGNFTNTSGVEAYAWFVWDMKDKSNDTIFRWMWSDKKRNDNGK